MGQSSANRDEPTMEDILSSIRRIIQTNEEQNVEADAPEGDVAGASFERDEIGDDLSQGADAEMQPAEPLGDSLGAMGATQEGELIDPPARDAHAGANSPTSSPMPTSEENFIEDGSRSLAAEIDISEQHPNASMVEPEISAGSNVQSETSMLPANGASNAAAALMSADSSARIASSFADLSSALAAQSATNLEEITHDIVRPLVKEWLDNNLPSMVERMVRDEIERIARGG